MDLPALRVEQWEGEDFVITLNGGLIGGCLSKVDAFTCARWLRSLGAAERLALATALSSTKKEE